MDEGSQCQQRGGRAPDGSMHLLSRELEEAINNFLSEISELEKLLPLVEE